MKLRIARLESRRGWFRAAARLNTCPRKSSFILRRSFFAVIFIFLAGCSSRQPAPSPPPAMRQAQRFAANADKLFANQNWDAAAKAWQQALDHYRLLNDRANEAIALHNLGQARRESGNLAAARGHLEQAADLNEELGQTREWWRNQIALLQVEALAEENGPLAARFSLLAPKAAAIADPKVRGLYLNELGLSQLRAGDFAAAAETFGLAERAFKQGNDLAGIAAVTANRARLHVGQQNFPIALREWQNALAIYEKLADAPGIARALAGQGSVLLAANENLSVAEKSLRRASENYRVLKRQPELVETLTAYEACLRAQNKSAAAEAVRKEIEQMKAAIPPPR